ncbi:MAG TPA: hypothetical protein PLE24_08405 [Chitinispirillaceae bacterium]|jgi:hypothetical protein|nr:hypothetical protein [Chitinispirillaceae bacterium]
MDLVSYYKDRNIRARIIEFLGGKSLDSATCMFIAQCDAEDERGWDMRSPQELEYFLSRGLDISRSLWDRNSLIAHLDIEYVNFDFPAEPYLDPQRAFCLQRPSELAIEKILLEHGIAPLHVLSGRGHHFVWLISRESAAFGMLSQIGRLPDHLVKRYSENHPPVNKPLERDLGAAFAGLALVMEYLAIMVRDRASKESEIPVELSAIEVPPQQRGREMISLDITEYGDLLNTRLIRVPFSGYLKPWQKSGILNDEIWRKIPQMVTVPLFEMDLNEGIETMRDQRKAIELASRASASIPDQSRQMLNLIRAYLSSPEAEYHNWYYSVKQEVPSRWPQTYDRFQAESLPPCIRFILQNPNDLLLKPAGIRQVVRALLSLGWHPVHIAGLIRSKYERDYGWGREWYFYDAATRAEFYTRTFAALIRSGRDNLGYFDCESVKKMQFCFNAHNSCSLEALKQPLLKRMKE